MTETQMGLNNQNSDIMFERTGSSRGIPSSPRSGSDDTSQIWGSLWAWPPASASVSGMSAMSYSKGFTSRPCPQEGKLLSCTKVPEMSLSEWAQNSAHSVPISAVLGVVGVDQQGRSLLHVFGTGVS